MCQDNSAPDNSAPVYPVAKFFFLHIIYFVGEAGFRVAAVVE